MIKKNSFMVSQAISGLQREILLLRNDLNFELWLSRENSKHIGRLYQDQILMRTAETERQGLYNKMRKYRAQVISLEGELREHQQQASTAKNKYADWNTELQQNEGTPGGEEAVAFRRWYAADFTKRNTSALQCTIKAAG